MEVEGKPTAAAPAPATAAAAAEAPVADDYQYDLIVIGGGSGGLAAAKEAVSYGARVALFDFVEPSPKGSKWGIGGTCVNVGCIPKKLMHRAAALHGDFEDARSYGWDLDPATVHHQWDEMVQSVRDHIGSLNWGYKTDLKKKGINYINAFASFKDPHTVAYNNPDGTEATITGNQIIIAVGGRPQYLEVPGAREYCITSDDLFLLRSPPGKTLVVGASYVALECAGFLTHLGFDTTVMVRSILLRGFDTEIANKIGEYMETHGTKFIRETIPTKIEKIDGRLVVTAQGPAGPVVDTYDTVLLAIGRVPNCHKLHLERAGVVVDQRTGKIPVVNDATNIPNIHCIGDAQLGAPELTPTAILAGKLLAKRLCIATPDFMSYDYVPTTVFTPLEYGAIGLSEEKAKERFGEANIEVYHSNFAPLEWTVCQNRENDQNACFAKLICNKAERMRVVGFHYLGPNAGEVTNGYAVAMRLGATKEDFDMGIGIHPTCSETMNNLTVTKSSGASAKKSGC